MIQWILERGLQVLNRLDSTMAIQESWTCCGWSFGFNLIFLASELAGPCYEGMG